MKTAYIATWQFGKFETLVLLCPNEAAGTTNISVIGICGL